MTLSDILIAEFDQEAATTRRVLERVPESKMSWQPHAKSMTMARLASHVAEIPQWAASSIDQDSLDFAPPGAPEYQPKIAGSQAELVGEFDKNVAVARAALGRLRDEKAGDPWSLLMGGKVILTMPRIAVIRSFVLSHLVHHRAQLAVYLRLNDVPVPSIYGPSADEGSMSHE